MCNHINLLYFYLNFSHQTKYKSLLKSINFYNRIYFSLKIVERNSVINMRFLIINYYCNPF